MAIPTLTNPPLSSQENLDILRQGFFGVVNATLQAQTSVPTLTEQNIGTILDTRFKTRLGLWVRYTQGAETSVELRPKWKDNQTPGATLIRMSEWSAAAGTKTNIQTNFSISTTRNYPIMLNVEGIPYFQLWGLRIGASGTGSLAVTYTLS